MHLLGQWVAARMAEREPVMSRADLSRASGLSPQLISQLLSQSKTRLGKPVARITVEGLARAFGGADTERRLWQLVAQSMGLPGDVVQVADAGKLSDDQLLREIGLRLKGAKAPVRRLRPAQPMPEMENPEIFDEKAALESPQKHARRRREEREQDEGS